MAANTTSAPAPAPSVASLSARQLASFSSRSGRPSSACRSCSSGWPLSTVELALRTRPVTGERLPGMPMPTDSPAAPRLASACRTSARIARSVAR